MGSPSRSQLYHAFLPNAFHIPRQSLKKMLFYHRESLHLQRLYSEVFPNRQIVLEGSFHLENNREHFCFLMGSTLFCCWFGPWATLHCLWLTHAGWFWSSRLFVLDYLKPDVGCSSQSLCHNGFSISGAIRSFVQCIKLVLISNWL